MIFTFFIPCIALYANNQIQKNNYWTLDWSDEFEYEGAPDNSKWAVIHYDNEQSHKDLAVVQDGSLQLTIKKMNGKWRAGFVMTGPSVSRHVPAAVNGGHDRKMFTPPENGNCRLEIKFRGINAKGGGPMCSGLHTGMWLYSNDQKLPVLQGTKYDVMRGEIDMIEHTSGPGNKPWIQSMHIHHRYREGGKWKNTRSSQSTVTPTGPGELGYWGDTTWHVLAVEWGEDGVYNYMDGQLISKRTSTDATPTTTEDGREVWGYDMEGLYFAFDEKFPMALYLGSCIWTEPGRLWGGGIGPANGEQTDYNCFPFTMYYDYVRFYTSSDFHDLYNASVCSTQTSSIIDGIKEKSWELIIADTLKYDIQGIPSSALDLSSTYKAKWDNESLYILVDVHDDSLISDSGNQPWENDAIEIYIDGNNDKSDTYDADDHRYVFPWNSDTVYAWKDTARTINPEGIAFAQDTTAIGYILEIKIDWSAVGILPSIGQLVGFNIQVNDVDTGGKNNKKIAWISQSDSSSIQNPSDFGTILLENSICGAAKIIVQPQKNVTDLNGSAVFMVQANNASLYQWQVDPGEGFGDLSNNTTYAGVHTDSLYIADATLEMSAYPYRCIVSNAIGSDTSQPAALIIKDEEDPVILSAPGDQMLEAKTECQIILPDYTGEVKASDNYDDDLEITQIPEPGSVLSRSNVEVTITVTDNFDNIAQKTFIVQSVDQTPPVITSKHNDQALEADAGCKAKVPDYRNIVVATDNCYRSGELTITQTPAPYIILSDTAVEVTLTAIDPEGNSSKVSFMVNVADKREPIVKCPEDQHIDLQQGQTAYIVKGTEFDPDSTADNCYIDNIINDYTNASSLGGAEFPADTTTVVWTVNDQDGNEAQCSFEVVVKGPTGIESLTQSGIRIYPNPSGGILYYKCSKILIKKLRLLDLAGNMILEKSNLPVNGTIDISMLNNGFYFIQMTTKEGIWTVKIIKGEN